ncbi:MAG TPA: MarR family winged helix-turn-helix transcriptional regulator [Candidatus Saccharimonadales bacterium]|nr:MarR family winged helix-turn-helix transcriptional regulator [Candidatus Saccharimonadales bacterium]
MKVSRKPKKSAFPLLLHLSYVLQQSAEEILMTEIGVGLSAARIMSTLSRSSALSQREVAVELKQTEANVSRQLRAMKKQGLVSIARNKKDSRQRDVVLTAKGERKRQDAEKALKKQQRQLLKILNAGETAALEYAAQKLA